ncbi:hypothetical protein ACS0TY_021350 [Phlomoides rotata]
MRYTRARNIIERVFDVIKLCFRILRNTAYYPIKTQVRFIMTCFLLHNYICSMMLVDPYEQNFDEVSFDEEFHDGGTGRSHI